MDKKVICSSQSRKNCNQLFSSNNKFNSIMQDDGNLVVYNQKNQPLWASDTNGKGTGPYNLYLQGDANLVIYDNNKTPIWASNTVGMGNAPYNLILNNNGDIEIHDSNDEIIWSSLFTNTECEKLPQHIPQTQSMFFMPILTHAYYVTNGLKITNIIKNKVKFIKQLVLLNSHRYNAMVNAIIKLFETSPEYNELMYKSYYKIDNKGDSGSKPPSKTSVGHITGVLQEQILKNSLVDDSYSILFSKVKSPHGEPVNSVFVIFESFLNCTFVRAACSIYYDVSYEELFDEKDNPKDYEFKQKYLKYKEKYLKLKSELGK